MNAELPLEVVAEFSEENGKKVKEIAPSALERLVAYHWPGNVRELKNIIERLVIMVASEPIEAKDLPPPLQQNGVAHFDLLGDFPSLASAREAYESRYIQRKLRENAGNVSKTAEALKLERSNLYRKMKSYGIAPPKSEESA